MSRGRSRQDRQEKICVTEETVNFPLSVRTLGIRLSHQSHPEGGGRKISDIVLVGKSEKGQTSNLNRKKE